MQEGRLRKVLRVVRRAPAAQVVVVVRQVAAAGRVAVTHPVPPVAAAVQEVVLLINQLLIKPSKMEKPKLNQDLLLQLRWMSMLRPLLLWNPNWRQGKSPHLVLQTGVTVNHLHLHRKGAQNHHQLHQREEKGLHPQSQLKCVSVN